MDDVLTAPRDLTEGETSELQECLRSELISVNSSADDEEDADNLVEYAMDMIEYGDNVGCVIEELEFLELPLWGDDTARRLGVLLTNFFLELDGGDVRSKGRNGSKAEAKKPMTKVFVVEKRAPPPPPPPPPPPALSPAGFRPFRRPSAAAPTAPRSFYSSSSSASSESAKMASPSIAARSASFLSSTRSPPTAALLSRSSYSGSRKSWAFQEKNSKNDNPRCEGPSQTILAPEEEKENKQQPKPEPGPETTRVSLKDRLAAYRGASSSSFSKQAPERRRNNEWPKDRSSRSIPTSTKDDDKDGDRDAKEDDKVKAGNSRVHPSLKERMAAFQGGRSPAPAPAKAIEDDNAVDEKEEVASSTAPKGRPAACRGEENSRTDGRKPTTPRDPARVRGRPAGTAEGHSIRDRMAAFGGAKTAEARANAAGRRNFAAREPGERLRARGRRYPSTPEDPSEGGEDVEGQGTEATASAKSWNEMPASAEESPSEDASPESDVGKSDTKDRLDLFEVGKENSLIPEIDEPDNLGCNRKDMPNGIGLPSVDSNEHEDFVDFCFNTHVNKSDDAREAAESTLAWGALGMLLGAPPPKAVSRKNARSPRGVAEHLFWDAGVTGDDGSDSIPSIDPGEDGNFGNEANATDEFGAFVVMTN